MSDSLECGNESPQKNNLGVSLKHPTTYRFK